MKRGLPMVVEHLRIRKPCTESWEAMEGDETRRFCGICNKHVHDLGTMTRSEAAELVAGGRVCVRVRRTATVSAAAAATVVFALSMACGPSVGDEETNAPGAAEIVQTTPAPEVDPEAGAPPEQWLMGDVSE
jgi:hypothetical protein